jgi:post-segregation antitoxin (ccd killing protein)
MELEKHFIPQCIMDCDQGKMQLRYITQLNVETPDDLLEQLQTLIEEYVENWRNMPFTGDVYFEGWNVAIDDDVMEEIEDYVQQIIASAQEAIDDQKWSTSDGNPIKLRASVQNTIPTEKK